MYLVIDPEPVEEKDENWSADNEKIRFWINKKLRGSRNLILELFWVN